MTTALVEKFLPLQPSISDLRRYLSDKHELTGVAADILNRAGARLGKPRLSQADWKVALKIIETAMKQGAPDLALSLLGSHEYGRIPSRCGDPAAFHGTLDKLLARFPDLQQSVVVMRALHRAVEDRTRGDEALPAYRVALDHIGKLLKSEPKLPASLGNTLEDSWRLAQSLLIESDAAHGWDWTDTTWYAQWGLPYPFGGSLHAGVDLTSDQCKPGDGWELYIRRILTTDGLANPVDFSPAVADTQKYFALYNSFTGVLRLFVHYSALSMQGADRLVTKSYLSAGGAATPFYTHGLFNHLGAICHTGEDIPRFMNNAVVTYTSQVTLGWIVLDFPLAYDILPDNRTTPYYLNTYVNAENVQELTLQGHFSTQAPFTSSQPTFFARVDKAFGSLTHLSDSAANVSQAGKKLQKLGNEMTTGGGDGGLLTALGTVLISAAPLGLPIGATQVVQSIIGLFTGGVKYAYYEGTVNLAGEIRDEWFRSFSALLIADCRTAVAFDIPYFFKAHPNRKLGVFSLASTPLVKLTSVQGPSHGMGGRRLTAHYFVRVSVAWGLVDLIAVNPASGMTLESATIQVVLQKPWMETDKEGLLVLGAGIVSERDPVDGTLLNVFVPQFEAPEAYAERTFIAHGLAWVPTYGNTFAEAKVKSVLLRVRYLFRRREQAEGQTNELILTYKCNPVWVGGVDNSLESTLPALPT